MARLVRILQLAFKPVEHNSVSGDVTLIKQHVLHARVLARDQLIDFRAAKTFVQNAEVGNDFPGLYRVNAGEQHAMDVQGVLYRRLGLLGGGFRRAYLARSNSESARHTTCRSSA